ncbi:hypothetical protein RintRC_3635 [Richelia intracellularis]|nr:hypothetical protein RintRC_3635 [Richelia intracellularis]
MNTWLLVKDSHSLLEVINNVNYQGHPLLWAFLFTKKKHS